MAQTAVFTADFTKWNAALASAKDGLKGMEVSAKGLQAQLTKTAASFSGVGIQKQAGLAAAAIEKIGGVTALTAAEQKKSNAIIQEAIEKYKALGQTAPESIQKIGDQLRATQKTLAETGSQFQSAGKALTIGLTAPIVAIGGAALKAAIDFESGFAGVRKTVNASGKDLDALALEFRHLATTIPVTTQELNKIGEEAGALGIPKEHILEFTKVMAELGATTNLTSDQAADSIARIQNIFGAAGQDTDRFASTLVALGNAGASTESEIVEMAKRLAGAGHVIGLTQAQVLGFSSALASVGIEAEAGGTAFSKVFIDIAQAARSGGSHLQAFAKVAGQSADEFKRKFQVDAAGAITDFIAGLGRINKSGGDLFGTLSELGLSEIRVRDALLRASGAGDLFASQLKIGNDGWRENNALTKEVNQRYATIASQLIVLKNQIDFAAVSLGQALIPRLQDALKEVTPLVAKIGDLSTSFGQLSEPTKRFATDLALVLAAAGPITYAFGKLLSAGEAIAGVFAVIASPIGLLIAGLVAAEAAVVALGGTIVDVLFPPIGGLIRAFNDLRDNSQKVWQQIADVIEPQKQLFTDLATIVRDVLVVSFEKLTGLAQPIIDSFEQLKRAAKDFADTLTSSVKVVIDDLKTQLLQGLPDALKAMIIAFEIARSKLPGFTASVHDTAVALDDTAKQSLIASGVLKGTFKDIELPNTDKIGAVAGAIAKTGTAAGTAAVSIGDWKAQAQAALSALPPDKIEALTGAIRSHALTTKQLAAEYGISETAVRLFKNQLGETAKAQKTLATEHRESGKALDAYVKSIDAAGSHLSKNGVLTIREFDKQLEAIVEQLQEAESIGPTALATAIRSLDDDIEKLGFKAEASGIPMGALKNSVERYYKAAGLASLAGRQLAGVFHGTIPTIQSNTNLTREQSAELSAQAKRAGEVADAYHAMGLKTQDELNAIASNARRNYDIIVQAVGKTAPAAREAFKKVQEAEAAAAGKVKTDWGGLLDGLATSFAQLSQVAGGSFAGIVKSIGTVIAAMSLANKASKQMKSGIDEIRGSFHTIIGDDGIKTTTIDWEQLGGAITQTAAAAISAAGAIAQATAEGGKAHRVLGGAAAGAQAGAAFGPVGAVIGLGIGAAVGYYRAEQAAEKAAQDARVAISQLGGGIQKTFGTMKLASEIAVKFGVNLQEALARGGPEGAALLQQAFEELSAKQDHLNELLETYGIDWKKLGPAFQASHILQNVNQLNQDWADLAGAGVPLDTIIGSMAGKINDFLKDALASGQKLPKQFQPIIEQLIRMGKITDDNARKLLGLSGEADVDFKHMEEVANKYGISLQALGPKFQAAKIHAAAQDIIDDFQLLVENGADVGGVLDGMSDEISALVQQAIKSGVALPDTMKPWIEQLIKAGKLVDGNGDKLTDLSGINFEKPLSKAVDDLITKLDELIDKLGDVYGAVEQIPNSIDVGVHYTSDGKIQLPGGGEVPIPPNPDQTHGGGGNTPTGPTNHPGIPPNTPGHAIGGVIRAQMGRLIPFTPRYGTDRVPIMATEGERVLSVPQTQRIDQWLRGIDSGQWQKTGTDGAGGETHITNNFHISALDGSDVERVVRKQIIPMLNDAERRNEGGRRSRLIRVAK